MRHAGPNPDTESLLFAIIDTLDDFNLTVPAFISRAMQRLLSDRASVTAGPAPKSYLMARFPCAHRIGARHYIPSASGQFFTARTVPVAGFT